MSDKFEPGGIAEPDRPAGMLPGRRRLLRGGLGAGSVLMTLASRPVSAATCTQASAFSSVVSGKQPITLCSGRTPASWFATSDSTSAGAALFVSSLVSTGTDWPIDPATKFSSVFSPGLTNGNLTLKGVLDTTKGAPVVAQHCVAGLLNTSGSSPLVPATILTPIRVKDIWNSFATKGYYEASAGVRWSETQIIEWLKTTYT